MQHACSARYPPSMEAPGGRLMGSHVGGGDVGGVGSGIGHVMTAPRRCVVGARAKFTKLTNKYTS